MPGISKFGLASTMLAVGLLLASCDDGQKTEATVPDIPFAPPQDTTLKDPDNPVTIFRNDLAKVEHEHPLTRTDLMKITPANLAQMSQDQVDQVYGRITAGSIPDGNYRGSLFFSRGDDFRPISGDPKLRIEEVFGGFPGLVSGKKVEWLEKFGHALWKGKVFSRDQRTLRNMIEDLKALDLVIDESGAVPTVTIPRTSWLSYLPFFGSNEVNLLFPAKLYCGQSLVDSRRESIIVDYYFNDEIDDYRKSPDSIAGRGGLKIRDEIRMVRPGFYLGRAYVNKVFLLNFTLYNEDVAEKQKKEFIAGAAVPEDCWIGEQRRALLR